MQQNHIVRKRWGSLSSTWGRGWRRCGRSAAAVAMALVLLGPVALAAPAHRIKRATRIKEQKDKKEPEVTGVAL